MRRAFSFIVSLALSACALVANLGDRTLGDPNAVETEDDDASTTPKKKSVPEAKAKPRAAGTPEFCEGIVVYASFDGKLKGDVGAQSTSSAGNVSSSTEGKFGGSLSLVGENATLESPGAALWLLATDDGNTWPETTGSFAVWFRSAPGGKPPQVPVLYRPVGTPPKSKNLDTAGLAFYLLHAGTQKQMGLYQRSGGDEADEVLAFGIDEVAPFLRADDYNHYFAAWDQTGTPKAFMALNGGGGTTFDGTAPATFPDGKAPFRASTSTSWKPEASPVGVRLGGVGLNSPQGLYDDLVIWNRVLSFDEVAAVYKNAQALGDTCKLR